MSILVIVESPGKVHKIQGFLGSDYEVMASIGHIRGLPTENLGFDIANNFAPSFVTLSGKEDVVKKLKNKSKLATKVILCSDYDYEGEAIAWHCAEVCNLPATKRYRATFTEITKKSVTTAIAATLETNRCIDMNTVHTQFARMVLDKLIGYKISPLLWKEFKNFHLSAGRVQSPVVRLIVEREEEINKFASSCYFKVMANFVLDKKDLSYTSGDAAATTTTTTTTNCIETECENNITNKEDVETIMNSCVSKNAQFTITSIKQTTTKRNPAPPYTTSTLQQDASSKLGMSPDVCMKNAQKLYELGLITYMRTDAVFIADDAVKSMGQFISEKWGDNYFQKRVFKNKSASSQEAHEACRPTDIKKFNIMELNGMTKSHNSLYQMIWKRTLGSQMSPAEVEIRTVKIGMKSTKYIFVGKHEKILFEGYLAAYNFGKVGKVGKVDKLLNSQNTDVEDSDADDGADGDADSSTTSNSIKQSDYLETIFAKLKDGDSVYCKGMDGCEKFTKPPHARYTEASLIKKLDDLGIGRPATYANIVKKVQEEQRQYVERKSLPAKKVKITILKYTYPDKVTVSSNDANQEGDKNKLFPTSLGVMINSYLLKHFADLINYEFTANIESQLDSIATGAKIWYKVVDSVYVKLNPIIDQLANAIKLAKEMGTTTSTDEIPQSSKGKRLLGTNPVNGLPVYSMITRIGYAICEANPDKALSRFANFNTNPDTITLAEGLAMLIYPINLGKYKDADILVKKAKSVYINYSGKNYSIDIYNKNNPTTTLDPNQLTLDTAQLVIEDVLNMKNKIAQQQAENPDVKVNDDITIIYGRYGPYIKFNGNNIKIPAKFKSQWNTLTLVECTTIIDNFKKKGAKSSGGKVKIPKKVVKAPKATNTNFDSETIIKPKKVAKVAKEKVAKVAKEKIAKVNSIQITDTATDTATDKPKKRIVKAKANANANAKANAKANTKAKPKPKPKNTDN